MDAGFYVLFVAFRVCIRCSLIGRNDQMLRIDSLCFFFDDLQRKCVRGSVKFGSVVAKVFVDVTSVLGTQSESRLCVRVFFFQKSDTVVLSQYICWD